MAKFFTGINITHMSFNKWDAYTGNCITQRVAIMRQCARIDNNTVVNASCLMAKKYNETLIIVTHDTQIAKYADRIITIYDGNVQNDVSNISILKSSENEEEKAI